jgi:hypothetical protein
MDNCLLKISFSMSTSIIGIILSVGMTLCNTFFSCEKVYLDTVERFVNELDYLWNMSTSNKLPNEMSNFEADRDPIEALAEDLISKELGVEIGFVALTRPVSRWWGKGDKVKYDKNASLPVSEKPVKAEVVEKAAAEVVEAAKEPAPEDKKVA